MEDRPNILRELRICRFCLTEKEPLSDIYVKDKNNAIPLPLQIMACVALEVFANDGMPQLICDNCRNQTRKSYTFKTVCKRSDDALKLYLATGVLKRGDSEVEVNKSLKRPTKEDDNKVNSKRKRNSEENSKILHVSSSEVKREEICVSKAPKDNIEITNINKETESVEKPNNSKTIEIELVQTEENLEHVENMQETDDGESKVIEVIEQSHEYIVPEKLTEENKILLESEMDQIQKIEDTEMSQLDENVEELEENEMSFPNVQIITDSEMGDIEMVYERENIDEESEIHAPKVPQIQTQCFPCTSCERSFPLQQLLDIHMRQHTRERKFNCNECGKKFFSKHDLTKHCQTHTGTKPYSCIICDKTFSRATLLHRHEKVHISVPKYLCTYCDKTYLASEDLDAHMRTHKKNRPFHCTQCDKKFAFKQGLERHESTHNTDNPHKCNYCEESFSTPSKLQRHITCHAGARPYPCKLCPRTFLLSHHLTRHLRNHYNQKNKDDEGGVHKCDVCSMSFKRRYSLVNHSAIHSMVNLKCVICNKEFDDAQTVKEHITTHLSGLPFFCFKCEYSFENEEDLLEHEQKHFGESDSGSDTREEFNVEELNNSNQPKQDNTEDAMPRRRSQRDKKVKSYPDFLKDEDFSESEENIEDDDEEYINLAVKSTSTFQPVIRSETMKVYKGVKDKSNTKMPQTSTPVISQIVSKPQETLKKTSDAAKEPRTLTKITTLENLGLSKSTLDAMTDKSGFVEMKIGQKVIRVQKLMMTKADVQAMAEQGKIEMKGTKVVVKNTGGGVLDLNKLTNLGKSSPLTVPEDISSEPCMSQTPNAKGVRTYVKKLSKREETVTDIAGASSENEPVAKEIITIPDSIDIDVKESNTEEVTTSIDGTEIINV